ncbi:hypothetical protein [uncultured Chryseobacterium sp.]|uniref:hypothetical protein n=1 Tax=uncultured Chryseobacterium sp. TaxID=259322 RepID=UPI003749F97D
MKKISLIILLCFSLIKITAQSYQQQYIQDEQIRLANVNDTEIEIDNFISQNIDTYDFTEVTNNVNQIKDENGQPLTGSAYQNALLSAKKERLRNVYFEKNPEELKLYSAGILQQCFNGGFEAEGGSSYGYSFTSNHIAAPAWSIFNNNPGNSYYSWSYSKSDPC